MRVNIEKGIYEEHQQDGGVLAYAWICNTNDILMIDAKPRQWEIMKKDF